MNALRRAVSDGRAGLSKTDVTTLSWPYMSRVRLLGLRHRSLHSLYQLGISLLTLPVKVN